MIRIDPPLPVLIRRAGGWTKAQAHFLIDYGFEHDLMFVTFVDDSRECWTVSTKDIRSQDNISVGRHPKAIGHL
jgi:hypothetical protein